MQSKNGGRSKKRAHNAYITRQRLIVLNDRFNYSGLSVLQRIQQEYLQSKTNKK